MFVGIERAVEILRSNDDFYILTHISPDGDTLGSAYGLCSILQSIGKRARVLCADEIPKKFSYMFYTVDNQEFEADTIIAVDVADAKLLGDNIKYVDDILLCIDHHISNKDFAKNTFLDTKAAACAEIIYDISVFMKTPLSDKAAMCLYTGISTDTGCFKYSNTTPKTHMTAAKLLEKDFIASDINYKMFDLKKKSMLMLEREVIDTLAFYADGKLAIACVTTEMLKKAGCSENEDLGAVTSIPRQIEGVEVGVTIKQKGDNHYKISMRSSALVNASEICAFFGGGGHPRAAGCEFFDTVDNIKEKISTKIISVLLDKE